MTSLATFLISRTYLDILTWCGRLVAQLGKRTGLIFLSVYQVLFWLPISLRKCKNEGTVLTEHGQIREALQFAVLLRRILRSETDNSIKHRRFFSLACYPQSHCVILEDTENLN